MKAPAVRESSAITGVLGELAWRAMISEVDLSPKPGLVDSLDSGAHRDMNRDLFHLSAGAIRPYFDQMVKNTPAACPAVEVLPVLRPIGLEAEQAMFEATGGINTHKGQIFSLGVTLAAAVRLLESGWKGSTGGSEILLEAGRICQGVTRELENPGSRKESSHGEKVFRKLGSTGVRGEAEAGFPGVRLTALPLLQELMKNGIPSDQASLEVLIRLYAVTEDSTVLHRRGIRGLDLMQSAARDYLDTGGSAQPGGIEKLSAMNSLFIRENISPGGCADLLALTLFVNSVEEMTGHEVYA